MSHSTPAPSSASGSTATFGPSSSTQGARTSPPHSPKRARARLASVPEDSLAFALALGQERTHRAAPPSLAHTGQRSQSFSAPSSRRTALPSLIVQRPSMTSARTVSGSGMGSPLRPSASDKGKGRERTDGDEAWLGARETQGGSGLVASSSMSTLKPSTARGMQRPQQRVSVASKADWVVDLDQVAKGARRWKDARATGGSSGRVVLVVGDPSPATLDRLLAEPLFSNSLILLASERPSSAPSSPPRPNRFSLARPPSSSSLSTEFKRPHPPSLKSSASASRPGSMYGLPALSEDGDVEPAAGPRIKYVISPQGRPVKDVLDEAAGIARRWRAAGKSASGQSTPSRVASPPNSRRGSSNETTAARPRPSSIASFRSLTRSTTSNSLQAGQAVDAVTSPFDVLLHFLPLSTAFQPLLQQAVMLTTAALPLMDRQLRASTVAPQQVDGPAAAAHLDFPATLLHILPPQCPQPLPRVLDSFLASLIPASHPSLAGYVLADGLLDAPLRVGRSGHTGFSTLDVVLSDGLRSADVDGKRQRSYLGSFSKCRFLGLSLDPPAALSNGISRASSSTSLDDTTPEPSTRRPSATDRGYESSQLASAVWTAAESGSEVDQLPPPRLSWSEGGESTTSSASLPTTPDMEVQDIADASQDNHHDPVEPEPESINEKKAKPAKKGWFSRTFSKKTIQA